MFPYRDSLELGLCFLLTLILGCNKGCKSHNLLIYTLACGERGKGTNLSYFVVLQFFSKFSQVVV